jgi:two-component system nitrate/nitrite response regulator NarL
MNPPEDVDYSECSPIEIADSTLEFNPTAVKGTGGELFRQAQFVPLVTPLAPRRPQRTRGRIEAVPTVLIDQSGLFRAGLRHILNGSRFQVTGDCSSIHDIEPDAFGRVASVAVIGLHRDVAAVLHRVHELKTQHPGLRVIMLSDRMDGAQLVAAIDSGADGYLLRDEVEPKTILTSLETVLADGVVVPQGFTKLWSMITRREDAAPVNLPVSELVCDVTPEEMVPLTIPPIVPDAAVPLNSDLARLSERERLILTHLTVGASNKQIARDLDVAEATVKAHVKSLLRKLRVNNRTQAAMWAISRSTSAEQAPTAD